MGQEKTIFITGISGQLGNNLAFYFKDQFKVIGTYFQNPVFLDSVVTDKYDLTIQKNVEDVLEKYKPDILIHCASLANVEKCEKETALAQKLNHLCAKNILESALDKDVKLVYISTESVYPGDKGNFSENDEVNPQNYYGLTKYMGEWEFRRKVNSLILRTNFFGWNIQNKEGFGEWILNNLKKNNTIGCFSDAFFSCIYTLDFARILEKALKKDLSGVYNCTTHNSLSKHEFALKMAETFGYSNKLINSTSFKQHPFVAKRGPDLSMNVQKMEKALGTRFPSMEDSINHFYEDHQKGLPERIKSQNI